MTSFAEEMRQAADTIEKWAERLGVYKYPEHVAWSALELRTEAHEVAAEERAEQEREEMIARLAMDIFNTLGVIAAKNDIPRRVAEQLIELGWHQ